MLQFWGSDYFSSVFTEENTSAMPEPKRLFKGNKEEMLTDMVCTKECIVDVLSNLKTDKSPGLDGLHPKFLYELRHEIGQTISTIFNKSLRSGEVPQDWRDALVTPLFKKGNRYEPSNYRPVSLTPIVCPLSARLLKEY